MGLISDLVKRNKQMTFEHYTRIVKEELHSFDNLVSRSEHCLDDRELSGIAKSHLSNASYWLNLTSAKGGYGLRDLKIIRQLSHEINTRKEKYK